MPVLLYKLYGARTILNTVIQSLTPHNSMLNMSLVKHSVTATLHVLQPTRFNQSVIIHMSKPPANVSNFVPHLNILRTSAVKLLRKKITIFTVHTLLRAGVSRSRKLPTESVRTSVRFISHYGQLCSKN